MSNEKFDLRWNNFGRNAERTIRNLANDIQFTDVTLMSDDKRRIKAHKVILCSSSNFFNEILSETPTDHPLLFLKGIQYTELQAIVRFIYNGTTEVSQEDLSKFMKAATELQIEGLQENNIADDNQEHIDDDQHDRTYQTLDNDHEFSYFGSQPTPKEFEVALHQESNDSSTLHHLSFANFERNADGKFCCDECEYKTNYYKDLKRHKLGKHEGVKFKCDQCDREFSQKSNLLRHIHCKHEVGKIFM